MKAKRSFGKEVAVLSNAELQKLLKSYIPMTEASFRVLASLVHENHG